MSDSAARPDRVLQNYVAGQWIDIDSIGETIVTNPATGAGLAVHPMSSAAANNAAVEAAAEAFPAWRKTPVPTRAAMMFRYRHLLHEARDELADIIVAENGKSTSEALGELLRAIQYVENAATVPETQKGAVTQNVATSVDIEYIRDPLGVFVVIAPFNFPAMIPLYFSWAVATGNTVVLKPSELCPLTAIRMIELAETAGFPPGVVNMVLGDKSTVENLCDHEAVQGVTFVGSSEIAEIVYRRTTNNSKRCQAQGGANNHLVVTDTAVLDRCIPNIASSLFGCASQRCFAGSNLLVYRSVYDEVVSRLVVEANAMKLGRGTDPDVGMGPVINEAALDKYVAAIDAAEAAGANLILDGRGVTVDGCEGGHWLGPTLIETNPTSAVWTTELFGPVRCIHPIDSLDEAIDIINDSTYGHSAVIYTERGGLARRFSQAVETGQVGINVGTPAPIAFYPVGGRKSSFYGALRGRGVDAVDFYTDKKVIVTTWHDTDGGDQAGVDPAFEGTV
ncbi:MAG: CoA-acylating methylmalonate-semialdehyde dehydrogenase [Actinobacteria bacterium]|nr:CoA-acylating methylmalonate-semialdehyde dehydrogenase [Actinomycetota bacterium]